MITRMERLGFRERQVGDSFFPCKRHSQVHRKVFGGRAYNDYHLDDAFYSKGTCHEISQSQIRNANSKNQSWDLSRSWVSRNRHRQPFIPHKGSKSMLCNRRSNKYSLPPTLNKRTEHEGKFFPYAGLFSNSSGLHSFIESKQYDFHHSGSLHISEFKKGFTRTISLSNSLTVWIIESLEHHTMTFSDWDSTRFEGVNSASIKWGSNYFGNFVKITTIFKGNRSTICVTLEAGLKGLKFFIKGLSCSLTDKKELSLAPEGEKVDVQNITTLEFGNSELELVDTVQVKELQVQQSLDFDQNWQVPLAEYLRCAPHQDETSELSIPSLLFHEDIADLIVEDYNIELCGKGDFDEEFKLLEPLFTDHFEGLFKESSCYL